MKTYKANCIYGGYWQKTAIVTVDKSLDLQPKAQAGIVYKKGIPFLVSYESYIIGYDPQRGCLVYPSAEYGIHPNWIASPDYSRTTARHVTSFCREICPQYNYYDCKKFWHDSYISRLSK